MCLCVPVPVCVWVVQVLKILLPAFYFGCFFVSLQATLTGFGIESERGIKEALSLKGLTRVPYVARAHGLMCVCVCVCVRDLLRLCVCVHSCVCHGRVRAVIRGV